MTGRVREHMDPQPHTIRDDQSVVAAARRMRQAQGAPLIVIDADNLVSGVVTSGDIALRVVADAQDPAQTPVGVICTREVTLADPDEDVEEAYDRMRERSLQRLPVVEGGRLVGLLRRCEEERGRVIELGESEAATRPSRSSE